MNIIDKIKKSDFSYSSPESRYNAEFLKVEVELNNEIRIDIYFSETNGYFPIIRNFFGKDRDRELNCYPTLSEAKQALKKENLL
jgi:hypothetical protein